VEGYVGPPSSRHISRELPYCRFHANMCWLATGAARWRLESSSSSPGGRRSDRERSACDRSGRSQAAALAETVAAFRHPKLAAVRLAGELNKKPIDSASLDDLLQRLKTQLMKLAPIIDLEILREPEGVLSLRERTQARLPFGRAWLSHAATGVDDRAIPQCP
jgi:hypothetical protein